MNHRGSLAYYPAAVVCGSFFLAASYYPYLVLLGARSGLGEGSRGFLAASFFAVLLSTFPLLVWATLLRWLARRQKWTGATEWMAAGVCLFALVVGALEILARLLAPFSWPVWVDQVFPFFFAGPRFMLRFPLWLPLPAVIVTAYVLLRVHRAFEPKPEPPAA